MGTKKTTEVTTEPQPEQTVDNAAALDELEAMKEDETPDYDPAEDDQADSLSVEEKKAAALAAKASAMVTVQMMEAGLSMLYPGVNVADTQKAMIAEKLAPVLEKYNAGGMPPWLAAYKEELELLVSIATVGVSVYMQVKLRPLTSMTGAGQGGQDGGESKSQVA